MGRKFRFKPSPYQVSITSSSSSGGFVPHAQATSVVPVGTQCDLSKTDVPTGVSFADLRLFHHFVISTYKTLVFPDGYDLWQNHIPQWSTSYSPIFHLILALSALHLSRERPDLQDECLSSAEEHFNKGVRASAAVVSHLDTENCQSIYISAVLICFVYFGKGPQPGEYIAFSERGPGEWLTLMGGVRSILFSKGDKIFTGVLKPKVETVSQPLNPTLQNELLEHQAHIQDLRCFIEQKVTDDACRDIYVSEIEALLQTFEEVYKHRASQMGGIGLMHLTIGWIYRLSGQFITFLQEKNPFALAILAYWAILLKYMRPVWFMEGWDKHVIFGIRKAQHDGLFQSLIKWPVLQVQLDHPQESHS